MTKKEKLFLTSAQMSAKGNGVQLNPKQLSWLKRNLLPIDSKGIEEERPLDTMDEHWGKEEEQIADEAIASYEGRGRKHKKETQVIICKGVACSAITVVAPKAIRERLLAISKTQGVTISDYVIRCITAHLPPKNLLPPHKAIIDIGPQSPIPIDHSQDSRDLYMSTDEVCDAISLSKTTLCKMAREGVIPCIKVGKAFVFKKKDVKHYLRNRAKQ